VRFKVFDAANTPDLKTNRITALLPDNAGNLWVGCGAPDLATFSQDRFHSVVFPGGGLHESARFLTEDGAGALWIACPAEGVFRWHRSELVWVSRQPPGEFSCLALARDGSIWLRSGADVAQFATDPGGAVREVSRNPNVRPDVLCAARDGGIWVACSDLVRRWYTGHWQDELALAGETGETPRRLITALLEDSRGGLWIGTYGGGLFYFTGQVPPTRVASDGPLSQNVITCLCEDREGSIWVGTDGGGLHRVKRRRLRTLYLPAPYSEHIFQTVCLAHDGGLWAGTDGAGLFHLQNGDFSRFAETEGLVGLHVTSVLEDRHTNLWVGTSRGLFQRELGGSFRQLYGASFSQDRVVALYEDRHGQLWLGNEGGVACIRDGRLETCANAFPGEKPDVRAFAEDSAGHLLVATMASGLNWITNGHLARCVYPAVFSDNVRSLCPDEDGAVWVGTFGAGLVRFKDQKVVRFNAKDGLVDSTIHTILDDGSGRLWLSSEDGIFSLNKQELRDHTAGRSPPLSCIRFSVGDGLASRRGSGSGQPVAVKSPDGRLWIPNMKALVALEVSALTKPSQSPPVRVEEAVIDDRLLLLPPGGELRVSSARRRYEFHYTSTSLAAPEAVRFRYKLEGGDPDWIEAGSRRAAFYGQLSPGRYRFRVMASHGDGFWRETDHPLLVRVAPQFWQTWWFITLAILLLAASVAAAAHLVTEKRLQAEMASLRLQQAVEAERGRIARDIHDDLGASLTQIAQLSELAQADFDKPGEARRHLDQIFSAAQGLARSVDEIIWATNPRNDTAENFANYLCKFAHDYLRAGRISCRLDLPDFLPAQPLASPVRHHLYMATKEILHNILKHARATEVWLRITLEGETLTLNLADNGKGFGLKDQRVPAEWPYTPAGDGLKNLQSRLAQIGGRCEQSSQPGQGTTTKLTVPVASKQPLALS